MKKNILIALLLIASSAFVVAQELKLSGEAKTGLYSKKEQLAGQKPKELVRIHSMDDAGGEGEQGRFRLNLDYDNGNNFGMKARIQWQQWKEEYPKWQYAFGYGNFFDNQLTMSVGKLGASPWGTGGPEMWKELEVSTSGGGARLEYKPAFIPGSLNMGAVFNYFDTNMDQGVKEDEDVTIMELLKESVVGVSYTLDDYFHIRFAYRFDSKLDAIQGTNDNPGTGIQDEFIYRVEERALRNVLYGLSIWGLGSLKGISAQDDGVTYYQNWLFFQYAPDLFTAQIRFGYDYIPGRSLMHIKPSFYLNLLDKMISIGASFWYGQDYGKKVWDGSPYQFIEAEPKLQINFTSSYIAFVYNWRKEYWGATYDERGDLDPIKQTQRVNLRFCIYF